MQTTWVTAPPHELAVESMGLLMWEGACGVADGESGQKVKLSRG